jgi:hypothetical protein
MKKVWEIDAEECARSKYKLIVGGADSTDPDLSHISVIVNNNFLIHHIIDVKFSYVPLKLLMTTGRKYVMLT